MVLFFPGTLYSLDAIGLCFFIFHIVPIQIAQVLCINLSSIATFKPPLDNFISVRRNIHFAGSAVAFHTAGYIDCAAPDIVSIFLFANHTSYYRANMHTYSYFPWLQAFLYPTDIVSLHKLL